MENADDALFIEMGKRLREESTRIWAHWEQGGPLYHYTTTVGLAGILQSKALRLTNVLDFSDASEFMHGLGVVRLAVKAFGDPFDILDKLNDDLWRTRIASMFYAVCFSTDGDRLSQWRAYADGGRGYAIKFDSESLLGLAAERSEFAIVPMVYDEEEQKGFVCAQLESARRIYEDCGSVVATRNRFRIELALQLLKSIVSFKHVKFKEEEECRLFTVLEEKDGPGRVRCRLSADRLVTYVEQPLGAEQIQGIVLGPCGDQEQRTSAVQVLLNETGLSEVKVTRSEIPLRQ